MYRSYVKLHSLSRLDEIDSPQFHRKMHEGRMLADPGDSFAFCCYLGEEFMHALTRHGLSPLQAD